MCKIVEDEEAKNDSKAEKRKINKKKIPRRKMNQSSQT